MKKLLPLILLALAGCTPPVDRYCDSFGAAQGNPEYPACVAYFNKMQNWFKTDLGACHARAVTAFPDYMYDRPHYAETEIIDPFGRIRYQQVLVDPDYARNASLDIERRKIVTPCMAEHGWQSPDDWQAGRIGEAPHSGPQF